MNEHEDYAQYAQYLATLAIPVSNEECRFVDKLPEIQYMSDEEIIKYLIEVNNNK